MARKQFLLRHDIDYWDKLTDDDKKWLSQALREMGGYPVAKSAKRILSKEETRRAAREAKHRQADILGAKGLLRLSLGDVEYRLEAPAVNPEKTGPCPLGCKGCREERMQTRLRRLRYVKLRNKKGIKKLRAASS